MKKENEIQSEIIRLSKCIGTREDYISSPHVDDESKDIYKEEIIEIKNDIKRLEWVLE